MSKRRKVRKNQLIENMIRNTRGACYLDTEAYEPVSISTNMNADEIKWTIVVTIIGFIGAIAIMFGLMDNSHIDYDPLTIIFKLGFFAAISCALICFFRDRKNIAFGIVSGYLILKIYSNWEFLKMGMVKLADNIASQIDSNYSGVETFEKELARQELIGDALVVMGMFWIFIFLFINRKRIEIGISYLFMLPFVIGILIISVYLSFHFLVLMGMYLLILFLSGNGNDGRKLVSKKVSFNTVYYGIPIILVVVILANFLTPKAIFTEKQVVAIKKNVNKKIETIINKRINKLPKNGKGGLLQGGSKFNGGNIKFNANPQLGNVSELKLTDKPELDIDIIYDDEEKTFGNRMYLKGKAYSGYFNDTWNAYSYAEPVEELERDDLYPDAQLFYPRYFESISKIEQKNKNACSGEMIIKDKFEREVAFYPYYPLIEKGSSFLEGNFEQNYFVCYTDDNRQKFVSSPSQVDFYKNEEFIKKNMRDDISYLSVDEIRNMVDNFYDFLYDETQKYAYENELTDAFIYNSHITVPNEEDIPIFYDEFKTMEIEVNGEKIDLVGHGYDKELGIKPYVDYVLNYLKDYKYDLSPGKTPKDMDTVDYFIENKRGYCMYFATTAALMFRRMGIASRYVEGYSVDMPSKSSKNTKVIAKNKDSHAWIEIFIPNVGWIPIEVTVGSGSGYVEKETKEKQTNEDPSNQKSTKNEQKTTKKPDKNEKTTKATGHNGEKTTKISAEKAMKGFAKVLLYILTVFAIVIPLALLAKFALKRLLKKYYYTFAYFTIDRYEADLVKFCKLKNINITENYDRKNSIKRIVREFKVDEQLVKDVYALIDRAKYSKNAEISTDERRKLHKLIKKISYVIKQNGNILTKIKVFFLMLRYK